MKKDKLMNILMVVSLDAFQSSVPFHVETSHLICTGSQMTGVYEIQHWMEMGLSSI